jgi:tetratricopeptide (TPR) repeat protein
MKNKSKIIEFPYSKIKSNNRTEIYTEFDFEAGVEHQKLIDNEDYTGLVQFCKHIAERNPGDLYAQYHLGNAYVLNGEYKKAIEFMAEHHKKHPWNPDYYHVILDSLFALDKTEDDFHWKEKPKILRISTEILDSCYEFLKRKRKPRSVMELYTRFVTEGYLLFSEKDLLKALLNDDRFKIDKPESEFWAEVSVMRKKRK